MERSIAIVTALNPYIGYAKATEIAQEALHSGRAVRELVLERKLMSPEQLALVLRPESLTSPVVPAGVSSQEKTVAIKDSGGPTLSEWQKVLG
ncbi:MAG: hypothetical protein JO062_22240 [Bryobacterales bacterium]|nr:hypothetical protein [Bryobacterales bacterium]